MDDYARRHMILEAKAYIASDPSDPFLARRVYTHIHNGVASPGDYTAEMRVEDGKATYHSIKRV